jgi:hypothetical protein
MSYTVHCAVYLGKYSKLLNLCAGSGGWAAVPGASSADSGRKGTEDDSLWTLCSISHWGLQYWAYREDGSPARSCQHATPASSWCGGVTVGECKLELVELLILSNRLWMQFGDRWTWVTDGGYRLELVELESQMLIAVWNQLNLSHRWWVQVGASWTWVTDVDCSLEPVELELQEVIAGWS